MSQTLFVWIVIGVALLGANLPFLTERVLGVIKLARFADGKPLWFRFAELLVMYAVVGVISALLERGLGPIYPQRWEFFATTFTLFITFAFPGFIWRYLRRGA
jgi:hypothetical protein